MTSDNGDDAYERTSEELLLKAEEALSERDLLQASEKLWGATAHMVKAVAQQRGWEHSSHRALYRVIDRLVEETGDAELGELFLVAGQLHTNFYENWLSHERIATEAPRISELVKRLGALT